VCSPATITAAIAAWARMEHLVQDTVAAIDVEVDAVAVLLQ
jgi:hypothetical protein